MAHVPKTSHFLLVIFVLGFAMIGAVALELSRAATPTASVQAEAGTRTTNAQLVADSTASGSSAVKFANGGSGGTGACTLKPSAGNVGASGTLTSISTGDMTLHSGESLQDTYLTNGGISINGDNVTLKNVRARDGLYIYNSSGVLVDHFTGNDGMAISSSQGVTVQYSNIGPTTADSIHVTSDRGSMNQNIQLLYNYLHDPNVPDDAHYDGTQVRGVDGLTISCSTYDAGAYQHMYNAQIYLEDANGGNSNVTVSNNWLYGTGYVFMIDSVANAKLLNNHLGGDIHWGFCTITPGGSYPGFTSTGNVNDSDNSAITLCQ